MKCRTPSQGGIRRHASSRIQAESTANESKKSPEYFGVRQVPLLEESGRADRINIALREKSGVCLGKALCGGFDAEVDLEEYRRMAAVEDEMWFYGALHGHVERELIRAFGMDGVAPDRVSATHRTAEVATKGEGGVMRGYPAGGDRPRAILDAGCGTGGLIRRLETSPRRWQWTGIDVEPLACELARSRCAAAIVQGSLLALPFAENTFDAVVCSDVLYHLADDVAALREIVRVVKPGGAVVINVPAHRWLWSYHDVTVHGRRRYERPGLRAKLHEAGLMPERMTHWNMLPLPLVLIRRKLLPAPRSGSDVRLYPRPVEAALRWAMRAERWWLTSVSALPLGSSILVTARKRT